MTLSEIWPIISTALSLVTVLITGLATLIARSLIRSINELQSADLEMRKEIAVIRELIAGNYVKRAEYDLQHERLRGELERRVDSAEQRLRIVENRCAGLEAKRRFGDSNS